MFLVFLEEYSLVYISGVVCVNGRVFWNVFVNVVKKNGVKIIEGNVELFYENN